jgi:hypothetical protein
MSAANPRTARLGRNDRRDAKELGRGSWAMESYRKPIPAPPIFPDRSAKAVDFAPGRY